MSDLHTTRPRVSIACSGNGNILDTILRAVRHGLLELEVCRIVVDRMCGAIHIARKYEIPYTFVDFSKYHNRCDFDFEFNEALMDCSPEFILLYYNRLISKKLTDLMPSKIINTHFSILPSFPGFGSIKKSLDKGCRFTGLSMHFVDESVDNGEIIAQGVVPVLNNDCLDSLGKRLYLASLPITLAVLDQIPNNFSSSHTDLLLPDGTICLSSVAIPEKVSKFLEFSR